MELLKRVQQKVTKMVKGLKHLCSEGGLNELGLFRLEERTVKGDLISVYKFLKGGCKEDRGKLFVCGAQ